MIVPLLSAVLLLSSGGPPPPPASAVRSMPPIELAGVVQPSQVVRLGAGIDGLLRSVDIDRGDRVRAGQVLATLDTAVEQANAELARARMESTAARESALARRDLAQRKLERHESLIPDGIVSTDEIDTLRIELRIAELALLQVEEDDRRARFEYQRAAAVLAQGTVRSPFDGVVVERFLSPGELLSKSGVSEVCVVAQIDPLVIELHAPLGLLTQIAPDQVAEVVLDGLPHETYAARVSVVGHIVDTASSTFPVRLELPNSTLGLPAGVRCTVRFPSPAQ